MALLIVNLDKQIGNAQAWRDTFAAQLPELEIRIWPEAGNIADIEYLAFIRPDFGALPDLPNLKAMFSRSAGVEAFVDHPRLPTARLGKIEPSGGDRIRHHARAAVSPRHAGLPRGAGQS